MIKGKTIKFGDNIDTDQIIAANYLAIADMSELAKHAFENHTNFVKDFVAGDIIVGEENFGCGSSREQAVAVLRERGVSAIIAKSFARIFYRNAINLGIPVIECKNTNQISELDILQIDIASGKINNLTTKESYLTEPMPEFIRNILEAGGIINQHV